MGERAEIRRTNTPAPVQPPANDNTAPAAGASRSQSRWKKLRDLLKALIWAAQRD
jgi:hypothetical protein